MSFVNLHQVLHYLSFIEVVTKHHKLFSYTLHVILLIQNFAVAGNIATAFQILDLFAFSFLCEVSGLKQTKEILLFDTYFSVV